MKIRGGVRFASLFFCPLFERRQGVLRLFLPFTSAVTQHRRPIAFSVLLAISSIFVASSSFAQARDIWGLRLGVLGVPGYPGAHPLIQPFYETPTSYVDPITMTFDVTLGYLDFSQLGGSFHFVDYGFHAGVRYRFRQAESFQYFTSLLIGADVFPDPPLNDPGRVCAAFPLTFGAIDKLSRNAELEFGLTARPSWYFRQSWDFSYALTIGARFPTF
jgi:hypothetical protein